MTIADPESIENFKNQIRVLENLQKSVEHALGEANKKLERMNKGDPIEEIFKSN